MDRRTLLAITLCFFIFVGWQKYYIEPQQAQVAQQQQAAAKAAAGSASTSASTTAGQTLSSAKENTPPAKQVLRPESTVELPLTTGTVTLSDLNRLLKEWSLSNYRVSLDRDSKPVSLTSFSHQPSELEVAFDHPDFAYLNQVQGKLTRTPTGANWLYEDHLVRMGREITVAPGASHLNVRFTFDFKTAQRPNFAFISVAAQVPDGKDNEEHDRQLLYFTNNAIERVVLAKASLTEVKTTVRYVGTATRYFVLAAVPAEGSIEPRALVQPIDSKSSRVSMVYPIAGASTAFPMKVYFGPKDLSILRAVEPTLDHVVDLGWFTIFAYPLLKLLKWFYQYVGNYGVAIILLTLLLKIVTYPLTYKSMKSMKEMAKLQPQIQKLKEKHGDDKEAFNREMLVLMRTHGANPMSGCLPMLVQMPIFFALYRVLYESIELYQAPFALWIHDLSAHDPFYVTPVLLTLVMYIQQKLTPNTSTDPIQAKMLQFMPIMFGVFMLALPSGLTIYMLVNAIAGIGQQILLNKKFDSGHVAAVPAGAR